MRLWHESLIPLLPRQQLLGQHRECCALRGRGWGKKHSIVNYVFKHPPFKLYKYHIIVMDEMGRRGYNVEKKWFEITYRGKSMDPYEEVEEIELTEPIYLEHDTTYLQECLDNLKGKGIIIEMV